MSVEIKMKPPDKEADCHYCHLPLSKMKKPYWKNGVVLCERCHETYRGQQGAKEPDGRRKYKPW